MNIRKYAPQDGSFLEITVTVTPENLQWLRAYHKDEFDKNVLNLESDQPRDLKEFLIWYLQQSAGRSNWTEQLTSNQ